METTNSCQRCYERKVKCDKAQPRCSNCVKHGIPCEPSQAAAAKKRKREADASPGKDNALVERIERYEGLLNRLASEVATLKANAGNGDAKVRSIMNIARPPRPPQEEFDDVQSFLHAAEQEPDPIVHMSEQLLMPDATNGPGASPNTTGNRAQTQTVFHFLDLIFKSDDATAVLYGPPEGEVAVVAHPLPFDASHLWQTYCDNVHPLAKMVDVNATQRLIRRVASGDQASAAENALLFAIYATAVTTMTSEQCLKAFEKTAEDYQAELRSGARYWLWKARFWKTQEFQVLQAYVILLAGLHRNVDSRTIATFTATADRTAKRLGLHRLTPSALDPAAAELQLRVWWELQIMEARSCEKCGLGASVLSNNRSIALPSMREDVEQTTSSASDPETVSPSPEMLCYLVRVETTKFLADLRLQQGGEVGWTEFSTAQWSLSHKLALIRDFQQRIELRYLIHCDVRDRVQHFTKRFADLIVTRMRLAAYIAEESLQARSGTNGDSKTSMALPSTRTDATVNPSDETHTVRTQMLMLCLQVLDNFAFLLREPVFQGFTWMLGTNMPFVAFVHLFRLLRTHTTGPLVERIWKSVETNAMLWRGPPPAPGTKQKSLFNYPLIKAWTARKAALAQWGDEREDPPFIQAIRKALAEDDAPHKIIRAAAAGTHGHTLASSDAIGTVQSTDTTLSADPSSDVDWEQWFQDFVFSAAGPVTAPLPGFDATQGQNDASSWAALAGPSVRQ